MVILSHRSLLLFAVATLISIAGIGCKQSDKPKGAQEPTLEANPIKQGEGEWKIATSPTVNLSVIAPGAQNVKLLYRPVVAEGRHIILKTLTEPTDSARGDFSAEWKTAPDFAGHVWAEISYPDGRKKKTE